MRVLGVNAIYHDPAAAMVVDGMTVAAAEEERFTRRKHGKRPVPFAAWETPDLAARWCLEVAGLRAEDLDAVTYSFDPALRRSPPDLGLSDPWDGLRQVYAERAGAFLANALPGLDAAKLRYVPHHVAHAASAALAAPFGGDCAVLVLDGRGEQHSHLAGHYRRGVLEPLFSQSLPHSLGLLYEQATDHLGFVRSCDEYKVMALASYGTRRHLDYLRPLVHATGEGGFVSTGVDWAVMAKRRTPGEQWTADHASLAASLQAVVEETLLDLSRWLHERTGQRRLALAGGVALNCVANTRIFAETPFEHVWVQPAAGDAGTALGGALTVASQLGDRLAEMATPALGRGFDDEQIVAALKTARVPFERSPNVADAAADELARDGIVAWFQGRSEFGPRARSPLTACPPGSIGQPDPAQRRQGTGAVSSHRADGPGRAGSRAVQPRPDPLAVHAVRPRRPSGLARPHSGGGARRRHRPHPDRRPGERAAAGRHAGRFRTAPGCRSW